jgi:hypothetical protein
MQLTLVSRADCELCVRFHEELEALRAHAALPPLEVVDVDSDALLQRRWGMKVPVLLLEGALVCGPRLDAEKLLRLLRL